MSHTLLPARFVSRRLLGGLGLLTLGSLLLVGCGGSDNNSTPGLSNTPSTSGNGPVTSTPRSFNNLEFTLSAPKSTFQRGEKITFTFTVKNTGTQPVNIYNADSGTSNAIASQGGQQVWYAGQSANNAGTITDINPGETKTYPIIWDQTYAPNSPLGAASTPVSSGTYNIVAFLTPDKLDDVLYTFAQDKEQLVSNPISVTVQ